MAILKGNIYACKRYMFADKPLTFKENNMKVNKVSFF